MANEKNGNKNRLRRFVSKVLKATIKGTIVYVIYFVLWSFLEPVSTLIPSLKVMIETFVAIYIILMIIGELTSGTIFQHFFNTAKSLFVICYVLFSLQSGIVGVTFENVNLLIDLRMFQMIALILCLLGFAKSILQAINYMNERAELSNPVSLT